MSIKTGRALKRSESLFRLVRLKFRGFSESIVRRKIENATEKGLVF